MTNEELLTDLKQFITDVSLQFADNATEERMCDLEVRLNVIDARLDAIQDAIAGGSKGAEAVIRAKLADHERRIQRLEKWLSVVVADDDRE